jgi:transporter family protein
MALGSLLLYFTALKSDLVSRVFPLTELGPLVAFLLAVLFLGEPLSLQRLFGTGLIVVGIVLIR